MKILITNKIYSELDLVRHIESMLNSPYQDNNWDGLRDCLQDLSWLSDTTIIEIVHESLPMLNYQDLLIYLDILYEAERTWGINGTIDFSVIYPTGQTDFISSLVQSNNLVLFNRMKGQRLRRIQFIYEDNERLSEVYFLFDGFCFSINKHMKIDYYPMTIFQTRDMMPDCSRILKNEKGVKIIDMFNEIINWSLLDCKLHTNDEINQRYRVRFRNAVICIVQIECYLDHNQSFCCIVNNNL